MVSISIVSTAHNSRFKILFPIESDWGDCCLGCEAVFDYPRKVPHSFPDDIGIQEANNVLKMLLIIMSKNLWTKP